MTDDEMKKMVIDLCDYERECLIDFAHLERRDVRWGAAMSVAVARFVSLGWLTREPRHAITENGVRAARFALELAYQIAKRGKELKRDMETAITGNYASVAGGSATARVSAGMEAWLTTNSIYGGTAGATDGANGGYTAAGTVTAATDGSSSNLRTITEAMTDEQIKHMVSRFLAWRLPDDFNPDGGISFKATFNEHTAHPMRHEPTGTNVLNADQAEAMVRHMLEGLPHD